jgi:uncharacterized protein GlcG (DUF336 family)
MTELTAEQVTAYMKFTFNGERVHSGIRLAVAIVDAKGNVLAAADEVGAPPLLKDIAKCKAKSCISIGMPTRAIMDLAQKKPYWFQSATLVSQSRTGLPLWGALGGVIIRDHEGNLIGAAAVAGDTGAGDEAHAKAANESLGFVADVEGFDVEW